MYAILCSSIHIQLIRFIEFDANCVISVYSTARELAANTKREHMAKALNKKKT